MHLEKDVLFVLQVRIMIAGLLAQLENNISVGDFGLIC